MTYIRKDKLPKGAFGELMVARITPFIQAIACYDLIPANFRTYSATGGSTSVSNGLWQTSSGTSAGGYGAIQSFRALPYNAGQGGRIKFAGFFSTPQANSWSGIGALSIGDELSFGYNGTDFGIWHRYKGVAEVRTITVTAAATGAETLSLTLNSVLYSIPLTSGSTSLNSYEITTWLNANQSIWNAEQVANTVIISAASDGAKSGTYTYSATGTSTGTITQNTAGVTKTSDHIPQSTWNQDNLSNWDTAFDPTKGNVYRIKYQYLGFGDIIFEVEDPELGDFIEVHKIKYPNKYTSTSLGNPSLRFGMYATNITNTTNITTYCGSCGLFVEGVPVKTRNPRAYKFTQTIDSTNYRNILTIRNRQTYNYKINQSEVEPINVTIANESTKNCVVELRANPTFSAATAYASNGTNLITDIETTNNITSNGSLLASFSVGGASSISVDLTKFEIALPPSLAISISAKLTSGASSPVTATLTWYEDI